MTPIDKPKVEPYEFYPDNTDFEDAKTELKAAETIYYPEDHEEPTRSHELTDAELTALIHGSYHSLSRMAQGRNKAK